MSHLKTLFVTLIFAFTQPIFARLPDTADAPSTLGLRVTSLAEKYLRGGMNESAALHAALTAINKTQPADKQLRVAEDVPTTLQKARIGRKGMLAITFGGIMLWLAYGASQIPPEAPSTPSAPVLVDTAN